MRFVVWLTLGLILGPSLLKISPPSWFSVVSQAAGGLFLLVAGWELRFLDLRKDHRFYLRVLVGAFILPCVAGYFLLQRNISMALAMGISALPVAIQLLKEKGLHSSLLGRRTITLASLCDIFPWLFLIFFLPKQDLPSWILSHWIVLAFFIGLLLGRFKELPSSSRLSKVQMGVLAPIFFAGLGWKVDVVGLFSAADFWWILTVAVLSKSLGVYVFSRWAGESHLFSWNLSVLLNARGAMEVLAADFAYRAGLIPGAAFAALVLLGVLSSIMAVPLIRTN